MEKKSPAQNQKEKRKGMSDSLLLGLTLSLVTLSSIDFAIHSRGAVSDPVVREYFQQHLGDITKHVGNFLLAAAPTIIITFGKKVLLHSETVADDLNLNDRIVKGGYIATLAGLLGSIMLVEGLGTNLIEQISNLDLRDVGMSAWAIVNAGLVADEATRRLRIGRQAPIKLRADALFPLSDIPKSADNLGFLRNTPSNVNAIFPN